MPLLIGWLAGGMFLRSGLFRPVVTVLFWWGLTCVCFFVGDANISRLGGQVLAIVVPLAVLIWALWDPARSKVKFWLVEGVMICAGLAFMGLLVAVAVEFAMAGFRLRDMVPAWPLAAWAGAAWLTRRLLVAIVERSHARVGERSVVFD